MMEKWHLWSIQFHYLQNNFKMFNNQINIWIKYFLIQNTPG